MQEIKTFHISQKFYLVFLFFKNARGCKSAGDKTIRDYALQLFKNW